MSRLFEGKVALVTGASSGIGRATARAFAEAGATVVLSDVNAEGGEAAAQEIRNRGGEATFIQADVSQAADVARLISETEARYGRIDYAHNNAGIPGWRGATGRCFRGRIRPTDQRQPQGRLALPEGRNPADAAAGWGGGAIVNTASIAGIRGPLPGCLIISPASTAWSG